jgi:Fe-S-cluster containining protein
MPYQKSFCARCGNCCREPGYVRLAPGEVDAIARYLGMSVPDFTAAYTRVTRDRRGLSLTEGEKTTCVFLHRDGHCTVYPVRPRQCRDFPHAWRFEGYEAICRAARGQTG